MPIVFFEKLNFFTFIFSIIFYLFRIKVYYFKISKFFRHKKTINILNKLNIIFLNYYVHKKKLFPKNFIKAQKISSIISKKISKNINLNFRYLKKFYDKDFFLELYLQRSLENEICDYVDYFESGKYIVKNKKHKKLIFFLQNKIYLKNLITNYNNIIVISFFHIFSKYIRYIEFFILKFSNYLKNKTIIIFKVFQYSKKKYQKKNFLMIILNIFILLMMES